MDRCIWKLMVQDFKRKPFHVCDDKLETTYSNIKESIGSN